MDALNFFLADVRGGLGAFVGVFLVTAAAWTPGQVGTVLALSGLLGIMFHAPVGAMIDAVRDKRLLLVGGVVLLAECALAIERHPTRPVVFAADTVMAILGGVFAPAVAALSLGLVPERLLPSRLARNAAWDRIGNLVIAAAIGAIGWWWSQGTTFYLIPVLAAVSAWIALTIPKQAIDHERARGFAPGQTHAEPQRFWGLFLENRAFLVLALIAAAFHFANTSMLPLIGQKLALSHPGLETALLSACILVAQAVAVPVAIFAGRKATAWGPVALLAAACLALASRGLLFARFNDASVLIGAQVLDGVATGLWDVLVPLILGSVISGSGRYSMGRGVLGTVQGIGGSLSYACSGALVMIGGFGLAFAALATFAVVAFALAALFLVPGVIGVTLTSQEEGIGTG